MLNKDEMEGRCVVSCLIGLNNLASLADDDRRSVNNSRRRLNSCRSIAGQLLLDVNDEERGVLHFCAIASVSSLKHQCARDMKDDESEHMMGRILRLDGASINDLRVWI